MSKKQNLKSKSKTNPQKIVTQQKELSDEERKQRLIEELAYINTDITLLADRLNISKRECLALLSHRELMLQTKELRLMHEHLDLHFPLSAPEEPKQKQGT